MKKRILVVDDEAGFTTLLKYSLEADGYYDVLEENDATRALEAAREFEPDVIILDIMMPEIDGTDVAIRFKESTQFATTPIIFMTALVLVDESSLGSCRSGGQTFLAKDTPIEQLIDCIEEKIARRTSAVIS